jgi:ATP-dependent protease Clp ATPase subunit
MSFSASTREPCDFCGTRIGDRGAGLQKIAAMATFNGTWICRQCVKACADILEDDWKAAGKAL